MKIGIILYSQTGNTRSAAEVLKEKLAKSGHSVEIDEITAEVPAETGKKPVNLVSVPDTSAYDGLVLAGQVQAFSLSSVMKAYLQQLSSLNGKKTALLVTKHFNNNWTGGSSALRRMKAAVESHGGSVAAEGIVHWSSKKREQEIETVTDLISSAFLIQN
jgi:NAD(P)H dehydrogenase (quinone)